MNLIKLHNKHIWMNIKTMAKKGFPVFSFPIKQPDAQKPYI